MATGMAIILPRQGSMGSNPKSLRAGFLLLCRASQDRVVSQYTRSSATNGAAFSRSSPSPLLCGRPRLALSAAAHQRHHRSTQERVECKQALSFHLLDMISVARPPEVAPEGVKASLPTTLCSTHYAALPSCSALSLTSGPSVLTWELLIFVNGSQAPQELSC